VWESLAPLREQFPATRWIRPDLLHLTLVFMGQVDTARVAEINDGLRDVARRHAAFQTTIGGADGHVDDRPRARPGGVAWLTLSEGADETASLALDADATIGATTYDERRRPRPHLTVARAIDVPALAALQALALTLRVGWMTGSLVLFRSHTGSGGSRYESLGSHQLSHPLTRPDERA
jgi:RNA 2',3'-cyclic 3'-phosphodiesterase